MDLLRETVLDAHVWWRIADPGWADPLDPGFAKRSGGRWNPPDSFPVLYLNEDVATARRNLRPSFRYSNSFRCRRVGNSSG